MPVAELISAPLLPPSPVPLLRAVGLDDVVASLAGRFSGAQDDLEDALGAATVLRAAWDPLQGLLRELLAAQGIIRATLEVEWRSSAAREHLARAEALLAEAGALVASAEEWLALLAAAEREAEDARLAAEQRIRQVEESARAALLSVAGA